MISLNEISKKYKTDKNTTHSYIDHVYENLFAPIRENAKSILEIGISHGGSLLLWHEYFFNATVFGIDIKSNNLKMSNRLFTIKGNAYDNNLITFLPDNYYDIIIDDGPHTLDSMKIFVSNYLSKVKSGGLLIIEDVRTHWIEEIKLSIESKYLPYTQVIDLISIKNRFDDIIIFIHKNPDVANKIQV